MRSSIAINNSTYFSTVHARKVNYVSANNDLSNSKQRALYQRLYYESKNCYSLGGFVYFYTLTYSERSITKFFGCNVHNYNDLRWLFNSSGFTKILSRHFNVSLKYCLTSEFGEGKGKRGYGNNPHYHVILFLYPIDSSLPITLTSCQFRCLIQSYWQGLNVFADKLPNGQFPLSSRLNPNFIEFDKSAMKFGFCTPGNNDGLVSQYSYNALSYVAKYVSKDMVKASTDNTVVRRVVSFYKNCDDICLFDSFVSVASEYLTTKEYQDFLYMYKLFGSKCVATFSDAFSVFRNDVVRDKISFELDNYRKNYKARFLCSQGLGYSCFTDVSFNKNEASLSMPFRVKGGTVIKDVKLKGQLRRVWFYNVVPIEHSVCENGHLVDKLVNYYRPNGNFVAYEMSHLEDNLTRYDQQIADFEQKMSSMSEFHSFMLAIKHDPLYFRDIKLNLIIDDFNNLRSSFETMRSLSGAFGSHSVVSVYLHVYFGRSYISEFHKTLDYKRDFYVFLKEAQEATFDPVRLDEKFKQLSLLTHYEEYSNEKTLAPVVSLANTFLMYQDWRTYYERKRWRDQDSVVLAKRRFVQGLSTQDPTCSSSLFFSLQ